MASSIPSGSLLPFELVENILYRVPVASLVRFKSTCKQWYALLRDKRFIYEHLNLSREGFIRVHDHKSFQFINLETLDLSCLQGPCDIFLMIHCDGLLLCQFDSEDNNLAVWNPFLRQVKWIKPSSQCRPGTYGFGYDNVSRDNYKILRFNREGIEIYEFKSQLWRSIDYSCAYYWYTWYNCHISMNGNMYWYAGRDTDNSEIEIFIQCFDFSKEVFRETCCVPFANGDWHSPLGSGFGGDRLSLLSEHKDEKMIQVWITNKVTDEIVSWSKYFNLTYEIVTRTKYFNVFPPGLSIFVSGSSSPIYCVHKTNRIMLWYEKKDHQDENIYVNLYEIGGDGVKKLVETGRQRLCDERHVRKLCYVFVPSLVPVPE
ncbi:putative F-box only protein 15 [Raphanus sativus]|uniref:F-box protein At3g08750-like n=1 Tax=Raphanus sativus TaxID=3726 RepID=A0A6J0NU46_RAPSA|nr:F-box protein At3g08750-like [Raphanus sativus]KAJ4897695.1 putative F-box only protein 15 [Raphanus sativus]